MQINQFRDFPGVSKRTVYPDFSYGSYSGNLLGGASIIVPHGISGAPETVPTHNHWFIGSRPIFSWLVQAGGIQDNIGATLKIETSFNGISFALFSSYLILPDVVNSLSGLMIPGFMAQFTVVSASASVNTILHITIRQQGL